MNHYLVFLEQRGGVVKQASIELWNMLQTYAARHGAFVLSGLLLGSADLQQLDGKLYGDGSIFYTNDSRSDGYNLEHYARFIAETFTQQACTALFFAETVLSKELTPKLSIRLSASLLSGVPQFDQSGCDSGARRAVYSGAALALMQSACSPKIYTVSSFPSFEVHAPKGQREFIALDQNRPSLRYELLSVASQLVMCQGAKDLTEADIIVAGGRGMGGADGFVLLERLAELLGGAVGASRPVVDEGWRPHSEQIGQTGKIVAPALYFACGISGSVQHLAGIGACTLVALNTDRYAPIFEVADYGIVGDVHCILPKLIDAVKDVLKKK